MESDTESEEPRLFLRTKDESDSNYADDSDKWDDDKLIQNYNKAIHGAKQQILRKVQRELKLSNEDVEGIISDDNTNYKNNKTKRKKQKNGKLPVEWEVGDACRAVYSEDGEEYEAEIIEMVDSAWCKVKYLGYENEEEQLLSELTPSLGEEVIKLQIQMAEVEIEERQLVETEANQPEDAKITQLKNSAHKKKKKSSNVESWQNGMRELQRQPMCNFTDLPPLPPPIPPASMSYCNNCNSDEFMVDSARNRMLLAWYNCGYQTGYYERVLEEQNRGGN